MSEELFWIEMTEPNSDEWHRLEPPCPKFECELFFKIAAAPALEAGCKFKLTPQSKEGA